MERLLFTLVNRRFLVGVLGIFRGPDGRVLLLDHRRYRRTHPWGLPGGWHRPHETLAGTIVREMREETGLAVEIESFFHLISRFSYPRLEVIVTGRISGGAIRLCEEIAGFRFVGPEDDYSDILPRHQKILAHYFSGGRGAFESACADLDPDDPVCGNR